MPRLSLSIVLCTFNGAAFLQEQLDSLLAQTRLPDQIVVGDDASSDGTRAMLDRFAGRAGALGIDVRLLERERNLGFVANFSDSLTHASGELLFLCDQDDVWHADKLAVMAARFEAEDALVLLCSNAQLINSSGDDLGISSFDALELSAAEREALHRGGAFGILLRRSMVTGATAAFRKSLLPRVMPVGDGWIHDEWIAVVAAALGRVDALDKPLICYRQHDGNQVGMRKRGWVDKWQELLRPRRVQFLGEVRRMESLQAHLASMPLNGLEEALGQVVRRRDHFAWRVAVGRRPRWSRLPAILRQAGKGNYRRYGTGFRSMLRDLLRHD